jgi:acetyl-CoA synthetase (ADP-forming)
LREGVGGEAEPGTLTEPETKSLLARYGIPVTRERIAHDRAGALAAARAIGYPVVLKLLGRSVSHKSDVGGVHLNLADEAAVAAAWDALARIPGFEAGLVQEMAGPGIELIVGTRWDETFGALVLVGFGGTLVELVADARTACAPLAPAEAEAHLRALRLWPLLAGHRGRAPADVAAAADAISRISWLAADLGPRLAELDVNPLLVCAAGGGVLALDARARLAP